MKCLIDYFYSLYIKNIAFCFILLIIFDMKKIDAILLL